MIIIVLSCEQENEVANCDLYSSRHPQGIW